MSDIDITGSISNEPTITGQFEPDIIIQGNVDAQFPAQVSVDSVTTGAAGTDASVTNVGTPGNARLQFTIPRGAQGLQGDTGPQGIQGETGPAGADSTVPGPPGADGVVQSLVAGSNITIDATDPANPIINSTASGSGDVVGPASAVDGTPAVYDGTTGKLIKNITYAAFKALLSLVKGDVGLGNVDNTSDATKAVLSATKLATARNIDGQSFDGTANITVIAPGTHAATGKATPVDADEFAIVDSAASNVLKKLTWANLKATVLSYLVAGGFIRDRLTASRTYYVDVTNGSDSNDGLASGAGHAFQTIQKAADVIAGLDINTHNVTVNVADGTYTAGASVLGPWLGSGSVTFVGNTTTPANVIINPASGACFQATGGGFITVSGMTLKGQFGLLSQRGSRIYGTTSLVFGAASAYHVYANGGQVILFNNYTINGGAGVHLLCDSAGQISATNLAITLTGTPAFPSSYANAGGVGSSIIGYSCTWTGSATGPRFSVQQGALINSNGGGTSYFPGNSAGSGTNFGTSPWGLYQ